MFRHRDVILHHLRSLGLRLNAQKNVLTPSQQTTFLGVQLDSLSMQARLAPARVSSLRACLARFRLGHHVAVGICRRLLGLMAAASPVLPLGLPHMRPFLCWMKLRGIRPSWSAFRLLRVSSSCLHALWRWKDSPFLLQGVKMGVVCRRQVVTMDTSLTGWGAVFEGRPCAVFGRASFSRGT